MKKTAFKTFVCSFVFSLFILFAINGLFFYTPQLPSQKVKIPSKNISLFFTGSSDTAQAAHIRPIKKIALNIPEPAKQDESKIVYAPATQPLPSVVPQSTSEPKVPTKDIFPVSDDIPLEIAKEDLLPEKTELVSDDFEQIMKMSPPVYEEKAPQKPSEQSKQLASKSEKLPITHPENVSVEQNSDKELHDPTPLVMAQADISASDQSKDMLSDSPKELISDKKDEADEETSSQQLLIPLQKDINAPQSKAFAVAKAAQPNQLAMAKGNTPLASLAQNEEKNVQTVSSDVQSTDKKSSWESMEEKADKDTPWVAAKGTKFPKNNKVLEANYYQDADKAKIELADQGKNSDKNVKLAAEMVQNILIPIPEDILKEDPLVPQLEAQPKEETKTENKPVEDKKPKITKEDSKSENGKDASAKEDKKGGLLKSITSLFSSSKTSTDEKDDSEESEDGEEAKAEEYSNSFVDRITGRIRKSGNRPTKILPAEMRLAFQPNRAEISGTTLKWIHAFANKVNTDRSVILEIRIDGTSSYELQQKRLNLLHNILTNKGVDYRKINTVFTTREPNSFIIRTVRINSNVDRDRRESSDQASYYQVW